MIDQETAYQRAVGCGGTCGTPWASTVSFENRPKSVENRSKSVGNRPKSVRTRTKPVGNRSKSVEHRSKSVEISQDQSNIGQNQSKSHLLAWDECAAPRSLRITFRRLRVAREWMSFTSPMRRLLAPPAKPIILNPKFRGFDTHFLVFNAMFDHFYSPPLSVSTSRVGSIHKFIIFNTNSQYKTGHF